MTAALARDNSRPNDGADAWVTPGGLVTLTAPAGVTPYYRLEWRDIYGERQQTTAGRTFGRAWSKAKRTEEGLSRGATPRTELPASIGIDYWLDPARPTPRGGWGTSQRRNMTAYANRYFRPMFGKVRHQDLRRANFQDCVNAAPTRSEGANVRRAARSLLAAIRQGDYLLDSQVIDLSNVWWHGVPTEGDNSTGVSEEESAGFVTLEERPSNEQVKQLGEAAAIIGAGVWWRELAVQLAAYAGPRWAELVALEDTDFCDDRRIHVTKQVEHATGKKPRLVPPKMGKRRTTFYPEESPTGYPLREMVERRRAEVAKERRAGTNPRGLMFPARGGTWQRTGNFHRDVFEKAALRAGWKWQLVDKPNGVDSRGRIEHLTVRKFHLTWHSLRHTFCTVALEEWGLAETTVAALAGHKNSLTTRRLYVGSSRDALQEALDKTAL